MANRRAQFEITIYPIFIFLYFVPRLITYSHDGKGSAHSLSKCFIHTRFMTLVAFSGFLTYSCNISVTLWHAVAYLLSKSNMPIHVISNVCVHAY